MDLQDRSLLSAKRFVDLPDIIEKLVNVSKRMSQFLNKISLYNTTGSKHYSMGVILLETFATWIRLLRNQKPPRA